MKWIPQEREKGMEVIVGLLEDRESTINKGPLAKKRRVDGRLK